MLLAIVGNICIIISIGVLYNFMARRLSGLPAARVVLDGVLFGAASIMAMLTPFSFSEGIIYDGRSIVHCLAGVFCSPVSALIAAATGAAYRIFIVGGPGTLAGVLTIAEASALGAIAGYFRKKKHHRLSLPRALLLGLAVHALLLACQLAIPGERWKIIIPQIAMPVMTLFPAAFALVCMLFLDEEERGRNLASLKESEARYKSLFEDNHAIMFILDAEEGVIIDANPAAEKFYCWNRQELIGMRVTALSLRPESEIRAMLPARPGQEAKHFYSRHRLASGDIRDVEVYCGPIRILERDYTYAFIHDISARAEAEKKIRQLNRTLEQRVQKRTRELEDANKELEAFAYSVSHDLRAPLRAIEGFSSLLGKEMKDDDAGTTAHYLDRIVFNARRMNQLIDDILRLSRISGLALEFSDVDLSALAADVLAELQGQDAERKVSCAIQPGMRALADKSLVRIAIYNLMGNAWKFTSRVPFPSIRFELSETGGEKVFVMSDNGVGFDMAYAGKLFSPFQRLHAEKEYPGSGIGLSIVRRILSRHGGRIWVESSPGKGAAFYFTLGG